MAYQLSKYTQELLADTDRLAAFSYKIASWGSEIYRDLPWRNTTDPYEIWLSEVMLQQTQVSRVIGRWQRWLLRFPTLVDLASAEPKDVLDEWQGMGYNRRALALLSAAQTIVESGKPMPDTAEELVKLPGIGPATAAGVCAFAYNKHSVYLETNVRSTILHELYPDQVGVDDREILPIVDITCPKGPHTIIRSFGRTIETSPRSWYYAMLDVGAQLKAQGINPSRRSKQHSVQSKFEGSARQKRAELVRILLDVSPKPLSLGEACLRLNAFEAKHGRDELDSIYVKQLLEGLAKEGFCSQINNCWQI